MSENFMKEVMSILGEIPASEGMQRIVFTKGTPPQILKDQEALLDAIVYFRRGSAGSDNPSRRRYAQVQVWLEELVERRKEGCNG